MYSIEGEKVYFGDDEELRPLIGANVSSFKTIEDVTLSPEQAEKINLYRRKALLVNQMAATDEVTVWYMGQPVEGADAASFEYFHGGQCDWGRDRNQLYCFYREGKNWLKHIKSRSLADFRFFDFDIREGYTRMYARDANHVYYFGRRVKGAHPDSFVPMIIEMEYQSRENGTISGRPSNIYYMNDQRIYYYGRPIENIDRNTAFLFGIKLSGWWDIIGDKNGFYFKFGEPLSQYMKVEDELPEEILLRQKSCKT